MALFDSIQKNYPAINNAAGDFLAKLTGTNLITDITLSAEMAGLMLLRVSSVNEQKIAPGTVVLGAIPDDASQMLNRFVYGFAPSNGLNPKEMDVAGIPADAKSYLPELTRYEQPFYDCCHKQGLERELFPFTAAASAGKLVLAGNQLGILNAKIGLALLLFHTVAGSKTFPYPFPSASP